MTQSGQLAEVLTAEFVSSVLNALDKYQVRAMNWGFFDLTLSEDEIASVLDESLPPRSAEEWERLRTEHGYSASVLASELSAARLLYEDPTRERRFRTRFAEGTRLLARLRQTFRPNQWATAPALVSDLKVRVRERRFPLRDQAPAHCWQQIRPYCTKESLQQEAFDALAAGGNGQALAFAAFQHRSFVQILSAYRGSGISGTVVSAGTGAGKTKAFYVPAFLGVIGDIADDPRPFTKVIAVYPRNVLLADQLREALAEASKLRPVLTARGFREITFGALLGDTPPDREAFERRYGRAPYVEQYSEWKKTAKGWTIPFLRSPLAADQPLIWRDEDRRANRTDLYRGDASNAAADVPDGMLRITREQIQTTPPDVLFLSLEMLNQHMGNSEWARAFGLGAGSKPRLLLLDEVHTHEGLPGAQAAWVLRRWRHWGGIKDLHVVGLSATLRNASDHLAAVAGVAASKVAECQPHPGEYETENVGMEYNVVLKGNPAAGTSLLASSIQTAMLLPRLLTPLKSARGKGALADVFFGRKVFGFTDKLDVVNRWHSDLNDAEKRKRLPHLRAVRDPADTPTDVRYAMERDGQVWRLPVELGHNLAQALSITRCSSQDPGANANSDLIVATAALEVGYDDPDAGATLHHKRPRSMASFIQRKGRAGRRRWMRPWTVVVLSDYGADRWAFQNAEVLLDPEVGSIAVPLMNSHVLRMQSAYFLVDWIGRKLRDGSPFDYLQTSNNPRGEPRVRRPRERAAALLNELLAQGTAWNEFSREFRACFGAHRGQNGLPLQVSELDALLWQVPRPLVLEGIPELLRKLESTWGLAGPMHSKDDREDRGARRPMPRQIPSATFAELDASEATLTFPSVLSKRPEALSVARALSESALGNVSKRYSVRLDEPGYWHPFSPKLIGKDGAVPSQVSVEQLFADRLFVENADGVSIYEPQVIPLVSVAKGTVSDTSKGQWDWRVHANARGEGLALPVLTTPTWRSVFSDCFAYLHRDFHWIEVVRYATECNYEIREIKGSLHVGRLSLIDGTPGTRDHGVAAVGFRKNVDAIVCRVPDEAISKMPELPATLISELRGEYFRDGIRKSSALSAEISSFLRDWLWQTSLAMLTATAAANRETLALAHDRLGIVRNRAAKKVLNSIFQMRDVEASEGEEEARLKKRIEALWDESAVVSEIARLESRLWEPIDVEFVEWARRRYLATLAQGLRAASLARVPELSEDDISVDILYDSEGARIILSEVEAGGVGAIERIVTELRASPDAFHRALRHSLEWCPRAELAESISGLVKQAVEHGTGSKALRDAFARARVADSQESAESAIRQLRQAVDMAGYPPSRNTVVSLVGRLLQPGTPAHVETLVADLDNVRSQLAHELMLWPPNEVFAYHGIHVPELRDRLVALLHQIGQHDPSEHQLFAIAQRLPVEGCRDSCPECLDQPNRYTDFGKPARNLTGFWLLATPPVVRVSIGTGWTEGVRRALLEEGTVILLADEADMIRVTPAIQEMFAEEVPSGYLLLPISMTRVRRRGPRWEITLALRERADA